MRYYTIYDKTARESGFLFSSKNDGTATRQYNSFISKNFLTPDEYKLLYVLEYNHDLNKVIDMPETPLEVTTDG